MAHHIARSLPPTEKGGPSVTFAPSVHPVGPLREALASLLSLTFVAALVVGLGAPLLAGVLPPHVSAWVGENRAKVIGGGFVANLIGAKLLQSGAFEIFLDDKLLFSKLQEGRLLHAAELAGLVLKALADAPA
ncbi:selenoprotein T [Trypanosoma conorhini]|uniref:Selenoprotein T n=1 Tax=Trypanosoma conorhini TaxID=83891 RepID=A0A3R7KQH1_9TRYP|nr:selenoprotein T [Trypanosoma conorhini]RNF07668.1 selenoprotein T [Trypanosoma conorhini]